MLSVMSDLHQKITARHDTKGLFTLPGPGLCEQALSPAVLWSERTSVKQSHCEMQVERVLLLNVSVYV